MNFEYVVEPALPDDEEAIVSVQRETWLATYVNTELGITPDYIHMRLDGPDGSGIAKRIASWQARIATMGTEDMVYVARSNDRVVGYCAPCFWHEQRRMGAVYVLPEAQGHGVGSALMRAGLAWHGDGEPVYVHVVTYNTRAAAFYERHGFVLTDTVVEDSYAVEGRIGLPQVEMVKNFSPHA